MKIRIALFVSLASFFSLLNLGALAQGLTTADYKKALWMTARMYGGQRSGDGPNWLTMDHTPLASDMANLKTNKSADPTLFVKGKDFTKDADGTYSLSGGWVDCGDHVKFGQTMFYSAYTLLKGYAEFPAGYDDLYTWDYSDYQAAGDFNYENASKKTNGKPNGIPDILDEVKYETDFFIKCARDNSTFYSQVGDGDLDHKNWVTSSVMATLPLSEGGQKDGARSFVKNPTDASMPSFCAATLALMSRVYAKFDPTYAASCLTAAKYAYNYAKTHQGTVAAGSFYPANVKWKDDYACACAELYWATGETAYKTEALSYSSALGNHYWCYNYSNNDDIAAYNLAKLGDATSKTLLQSFVTTYKGAVSGGIYSGGDNSWGSLRYPANAAFIVALWGALNKSTTVDAFIYNQIDYILGKNSSNFSFVVGFTRDSCSGCTAAIRPHHRNVYLNNTITTAMNSLTIPPHNAQHGYLIGGKRTVPITEDATAYAVSEGGIDYNAGLVGALGYIMSRLSPVDTTKFGANHPSPKLGADQSLCGLTSIVLNSQVATDGKKTFTWQKNGTAVVSASLTANTYTVTAAGLYTCIVDSASKWQTTGSVTITATIPDFTIGADNVLCTQTSDTLTATATGSGLTYSWKKNGTVISGATSSSYLVYTAGTYICTVSATGCASKSDTAIITSQLPTVVNDTICKAGTVDLSVTTTGTYTWYSVATGGTALASGSSYSPSITATTTYYVQDASSSTGTVGPTTRMSTGSNWGVSSGNHLKFTVGSTFTLNSLKLNIGSVYGATTGATLTIEILDGNGNAFSPAKTFTSSGTDITTSMANTLVQFNFTNCVIDKTWGTSLRMRISACTVNGELIFNTAGASFPYNSTPSGIVSITGTAGGNAGTAEYMYFYAWNVSSGSTCSRTPVIGVIDPNANCGDTQAPTTPGAITFGTVTTTSIVVNWTASTDNAAVTAYEVYMDGVLKATVTSGTTTTITGLTCNTAYSFQVRAKDAAGNVSSFATAASQTTANTVAPTVTTPVTYCQNATTTALTATGTTLKWYTVATGGTGSTTAPTPTTTSAGTTTYYVSQTLNSCEGARATIAVTVNALPTAPTVTTPVNYVLNATATALSATGTSLKWYTVATGGTGSSTAPTPSTTTVGTTYYYVSQTTSTCESPRATIAVVVSNNQLPVVSITTPATNTTYAGPASISFTASATDADGFGVQHLGDLTPDR